MQSMAAMSSAQIVSAGSLRDCKSAVGGLSHGASHPYYGCQVQCISLPARVGVHTLPECSLPKLTDSFCRPLQDHHSRDRALQTMASMSSAQIVSASAIHNKSLTPSLGALPPTVGALRTPHSSSTVSHSPLSAVCPDVCPDPRLLCVLPALLSLYGAKLYLLPLQVAFVQLIQICVYMSSVCCQFSFRPTCQMLFFSERKS